MPKTRADDHNEAKINQLHPGLAKNIYSSLATQTTVSTALFIIVLFYTLYITREVILPVIISLLLYILFYPLVKFLSKYRIPSQIGAILVMLFLFIFVAYGFYSLSHQAREWVNIAPEIFDIANQKLSTLAHFLQKPMAILFKIKSQLDEIFNLSTTPNVAQVKISQSYFIGSLFSNTWQFFVEFGMTFVLLYFLLASEDYYLKKLVNFMANSKQKKEVANIVRQTEEQLWKYLFARTIINISVAIVVSIVMYILDMPNPTLWGVMAGVLEFIPYLGSFASIIIVGTVSIVSFDNIWHIISAPILLFIILTIEGNFIAPYVFGRNLTINSITVILSIFFMGWIWGVVGALIAVPVLMTVKVFLINIYNTSAINELMSE